MRLTLLYVINKVEYSTLYVVIWVYNIQKVDIQFEKEEPGTLVIGSEKMLIYYVMLILGTLFVIGAVFALIVMYGTNDFRLINIGKCLGILLVGVLLLVITLPSLKYVVLKEFDVVSGKCVIEIDSSGRSSEANFKMLDTDEIFSFKDIPELDAYGKSIPYYCKVTVTKDHRFEIGYKIYDAKKRQLITTGK
ncbi:hypothetical protein V7128_24690 [Neobacillus vireti]|uniref:hypothetical protein n=1 Tax=Neobacillus vireti TaxID=220686 RepID=UPI003000B945